MTNIKLKEIDMEETFECIWCKDGGCTQDEYTFPIKEIGGYEKENGKPICQYCAEAASGI